MYVSESYETQTQKEDTFRTVSGIIYDMQGGRGRSTFFGSYEPLPRHDGGPLGISSRLKSEELWRCATVHAIRYQVLTYTPSSSCETR